MVRVIRKCLQTGLFSIAPVPRWPAGAYWVPAEADAPADCAHEKDLQICRPFRKRMKGSEPTTFCMASSSCLLAPPRESLQIEGFHTRARAIAFHESRRNGRGLDTEWTLGAGTTRVMPAPEIACGLPRPAVV